MKTKPLFPLVTALLAFSTLGYQTSTAFAQGTAFTYQGRLNDGANPANGSYDLRFQLNDAFTGGNQWGQALTNNAVTVSNGLFTTTLDFGFGILTGGPRWLQLGVRTNGGGGFVLLSPRTALLPAPYAVYSANAAQAGTISGTVPASGLNGIYSSPVNFNNPLNNFTGNGAGLTNVNAATLNGVTSTGFWKTTGNAGANPTNGAFLGTTDNLPLELKVNGGRVLRLEPENLGAPNLIGGSPVNYVTNDAIGATIAGGGNFSFNAEPNIVGGNYGTVGGGRQNSANNAETTVAGGRANAASGLNSTISGGYANTVSGAYGSIGGGVFNALASADNATIGGGNSNKIQTNSDSSVIGGGNQNTIWNYSSYATIGGGSQNLIQTNAYCSFIGGGLQNTIQTNGYYSTIGGGVGNSIQNYAIATTIGGGYVNVIQADADDATIGGGQQNTIQANASYSTIAGGSANTIQSNAGYAAIGGGYQNTIQSNAFAATIPGGWLNSAGANYAFAAGRRAKANYTGTFVWADSTDADFASTAANQYLIRAAGGVGINKNNPSSTLDVNGTARIEGANNWDVTSTEGDFRVGNDMQRFKIGVSTSGGGTGDVWMRAQGGTARVFIKTPGGTTFYSNEAQTSGVSLAAGGGAWTALSDRNAKENFTRVNAADVLAKVAALPLTTWNYKSQDAAIRHVGPMAQDFKAAFGVGESDTGITTIDADGVALAAIQGLNEKVEVSRQKADTSIQELKAENAELKQRLELLERIVRNQNLE